MDTTYHVNIKMEKKRQISFISCKASFGGHMDSNGKPVLVFSKIDDNGSISDDIEIQLRDNNTFFIKSYGEYVSGSFTTIGKVDEKQYVGTLIGGGTMTMDITSIGDAGYEDEDADEEDDEDEDDSTPLQIEGKHHIFEGIPINGNIKSFTKKMEAEGYEFDCESDGDYHFKGTFAGVEDATIIVSCNPETGKVYNVMAILNSYYDYDELMEDYRKLRDNIIDIYGEECMEEVDDSDDFDDIDPLAEALDNDEADIHALFFIDPVESEELSTTHLFVSSGIDDDGDRFCYLCVAYNDGENDPDTEEEEDEEEETSSDDRFSFND